MGCDIHITVEVKIGGRWHMAQCCDWEPLWNGRNYSLFALLAGVRNSDGVTPISPPKGIPNDAAPLTQRWHGNYSEHSQSWLTLSEMSEHADRLHEASAAWTDTMQMLRRFADVYGVSQDNIRIVFGFDS